MRCPSPPHGVRGSCRRSLFQDPLSSLVAPKFVEKSDWEKALDVRRERDGVVEVLKQAGAFS